MSRLGKICFVFAALTLLCFAVAKSLIPVWIPFFWVLIGLFAVFIVTGVIIDRRFFAEFFTLKTTKHGMNMGLLILGFLALVIAVNILSARHYRTWDFSLNQVNTLSPQSVQLLKGLNSELRVVYIYKKNARNYDTNRKMFTDLIRKYQDQTDLIRLEFFDADASPAVAKEFEFQGEQSVFLVLNGKKNRIERIDEQEITSALVKVTREKSKNVYFTVGHGEPDTDMEKAEAVGQLKTMLEGNNYTVKTLQLGSVTKIPEDLDVLFVISPKFPFQPGEIQLLESHLQTGGSLFVALSYPNKSGLNNFLAKYGIEVQPGFVMNVMNTPSGPVIKSNEPTIAYELSATHPITKVFSKTDGMIFNKPMGLKAGPAQPGVQIEELVTAPASVAFLDEALTKQGAVGKFPLGLIAAKENGYQLMVVGDSHFLENQLLLAYVNRDMVLNSVALLAKEQNLISISPKEPPGSKVELTTAKEAGLFWGVFLPIPLCFLISGLFFWIRRRHA